MSQIRILFSRPELEQAMRLVRTGTAELTLTFDRGTGEPTARHTEKYLMERTGEAEMTMTPILDSERPA